MAPNAGKVSENKDLKFVCWFLLLILGDGQANRPVGSEMHRREQEVETKV